MGKRVDSWPKPISVLKKKEMKLFHIYCVLLSIKQLEKKVEIFVSNLTLSRIKERS